MKVLGVRCSNLDLTYAILQGNRSGPKLVDAGSVQVPKGFTEPEILRWLRQELAGLFSKHDFAAVGIKRAETSVMRSNSLEQRIALEAIVSLVAAENGCLNVTRKVKATIAKDLGMKGKSKYLASFDTSAIHDFGKRNAKEQEAIMVGWSCLS